MISEDTSFKPLGSTQSTFLHFNTRGSFLKFPGEMLKKAFLFKLLVHSPTISKWRGMICSSLPRTRLWFENTNSNQGTNMQEKGHAVPPACDFLSHKAALPRSMHIWIRECRGPPGMNSFILFGPQSNFIIAEGHYTCKYICARFNPVQWTSGDFGSTWLIILSTF